MLLQAKCITSQPLANSSWSYSLETPNLDQIWRFFASCDLEILQITLKKYPFKLYAPFHSHWWIQIWVTVWKRSNWVKFDDFLPPVTLKFYGWPSKTIGHIFYTDTSFIHHIKAIGGFRFELQSGNTQIGSHLTIFCLLWPWNFTDDLEKQ